MGPALDDDDDDDELLFQFANLSKPIFTALHLCTAVLARSKMSVHMSVCLSVKRVTCNKKEKTTAHTFIPYERSIILIFRQEEWLVGTTPRT